MGAAKRAAFRGRKVRKSNLASHPCWGLEASLNCLAGTSVRFHVRRQWRPDRGKRNLRRTHPPISTFADRSMLQVVQGTKETTH